MKRNNQELPEICIVQEKKKAKERTKHNVVLIYENRNIILTVFLNNIILSITHIFKISMKGCQHNTLLQITK